MCSTCGSGSSGWWWRGSPAGSRGSRSSRSNAHVDEEERARGNDEPLSIRLATEFHILLAEMTGSPVLARYVSEVASRCGLILALYSRPHSSECAVSEHRAIIDGAREGRRRARRRA